MADDAGTTQQRESNSSFIAFRAPPAIARAVEQAAARELLSTSAWARRAVALQLRADGVQI